MVLDTYYNSSIELNNIISNQETIMIKPVKFVNIALGELLQPLKEIIENSIYGSKLIIANGSAFISHDTQQSRSVEMTLNISEHCHDEIYDLDVKVLALLSSESEHCFKMKLHEHLGARPKYEVKGHGDNVTAFSCQGNIDKELKMLAQSIIDTLIAIKVIKV
jgi:hypothetical protein